MFVLMVFYFYSTKGTGAQIVRKQNRTQSDIWPLSTNCEAYGGFPSLVLNPNTSLASLDSEAD